MLRKSLFIQCRSVGSESQLEHLRIESVVFGSHLVSLLLSLLLHFLSLRREY